MEKPPFTIIITTYKRPHLLKRAAQSALNQTWENLTVLILDDESNDETEAFMLEMAKKDPRLQYIRHPKRLGMLKNYQYGFDNVAAEYFSFLSDDDYLLPHFCETVMEGFFKYPEIAFSAAATICVERDKSAFIDFNFWPREGIYFPPDGLAQMFGKLPTPNSTAYKKSKIGIISIDYENQAGWDWDFHYQMAGHYPFAISKRPCSFLFRHPGSFTTSAPRKTMANSCLRMAERFEGFDFIPPDVKKKAIDYHQKIYLKYTLHDQIEFRQFHKSADTAKKLLKLSFSLDDCILYLFSRLFLMISPSEKQMDLLKKIRRYLFKFANPRPNYLEYLKSKDPASYRACIELEKI